MTKKSLFLAGSLLVFLLIAFRVDFDVAGANPSLVTSEAPRVAVATTWLEGDAHSSRGLFTSQALPGTALGLERGPVNIQPGNAELPLPSVVAYKLLPDVDGLPQLVAGDCGLMAYNWAVRVWLATLIHMLS